MFDIQIRSSGQRYDSFYNAKSRQRKYDEQKRGFVIKVVVLIMIMCMPVRQTSMLPAQSNTPLVDQVSVQDTMVDRKSNMSLTKPMSFVTLSGRVVERDSIKQTNPLEAIEVQVSVPKRVLSAHIEKTDRRENSGSSEIIDSVILSTLTDVDGQFSISLQPATYHLTYRQLGNILRRDTIKLAKSVNIGDIVIDLQSIKLKEVVVKAQKKLLTYEKGSLYFNVAESPYSEGFNAKDVLQHMPGMDPDPNKLSMIGKDGLIVLINGRRTNLNGEQLKHYLQSIESDKIERVEMQTNPSPEYSASGNPGVINIILKKNAYLGWDGSVYANYEQHRKPDFSFGGDINYSNKYILLNYGIEYWNARQRYLHQDKYQYSDSVQIQNNIRYNKLSSIYQNLSLNIFLLDNMDLGFLSSLDISKDKGEKYADNRIFGFTSITEQLDSITHFTEEVRQLKNRYENLSVSPYYEWRMDDLDKKMTLNYNYTYVKEYNDERVVVIDSSFHLNNNAQNKAYSHTGKLDFVLPFDWLEFNIGGSYTFAKENIKTEYNSLHEEFIYKEHLWALYADFYKDWDKWDLSLGMRYEHTSLKGIPIDTIPIYSTAYGNWFPYVQIGFRPNNKNTLTFGYSRRISRPHVSNYNMTRSWSDSYHYSVGNSSLKPVLRENIEFKYIFSNLYIYLSYNLIRNGICDVQDIIEETLNSNQGIDTTVSFIRTSHKNCLTTHRVGGNVSYTYRHKVFLLTVGGSLYYSMSKSSNDRIDDRHMKGISSRLFFKFMSKVGKHTSLTANYYFNFPGFADGYHSKSLQSFNVGAKFKFFNNNLILDVDLYDVFGTVINRYRRNYFDTDGNSYIYYGKNENDPNRFIGIGITYRFGNNKTKQADVEVDLGNSRIEKQQ